MWFSSSMWVHCSGEGGSLLGVGLLMSRSGTIPHRVPERCFDPSPHPSCLPAINVSQSISLISSNPSIGGAGALTMCLYSIRGSVTPACGDLRY